MIKAAEAERNVAITLQLIAGKGNRTVAQRVNKDVADAQKSATKIVESESKRRSQIEEKAAKDPVKAANDAQKEKERNQKRADREEMMRLRRKAKKLRADRKKEEREQKRADDAAERDRKRKQEKADRDEMMRLRRKAKRLTANRKADERAEKQYQERVRSELKSSQAAAIDGQRKATEAGVAALQGAMDLAEGLAILGIASDESFEKFAKTFIKIQAGFKAMKGLTELFWKGREALQALTESTKAQAAANALLSSSNTRVAATQGVANLAGGAAGGAAGGRSVGSSAASEFAGDVAGGAAGNAIAGAGVIGAGQAAGGTGIGISGAASAAASAASTAATLIAAGVAIHEVFRILGSVILGASDSTETLTSAVLGWQKASDGAAKSAEKLQELEQKKQKRELDRDRFTERSAQEAGYRDSARGARSLRDRVNFEIGGGASTPLESANRARVEALREVQAAEQELIEFRKANEERLANREFASAEEQLRVARQLEDANRNLIDADLQRLSILRDQKKVAEEQKKAAEEQIKSSTDALRAAQDAQKSVHQRFAGLSSYKQEKLKDINRRKQAGEDLTEQDLRFLERTQGFGSDIVRDYRAKQGIAAGSEGVAAGLGDGYTDAKKQAVEAQKGIAEGQRSRQKAVETSQRASDERRQVERNLREESLRQEQLTRDRVEAQKQLDSERRKQQAEQTRRDDVKEQVGFGGALSEQAGEFTSPDSTFGGILHSALQSSAITAPLSLYYSQSSQEKDEKSQNGQRAAGDAADQVTQSGVNVESALTNMLSAVTDNFGRIEDSINNSDLMRGYYS